MRILALFLAIMMPAVEVAACSCFMPEASHNELVRLEFNDSEAVFSAYVHDVFDVEMSGVKVRKARLRILQSWKGQFKSNSWLEVIADEDFPFMSCGYGATLDSALLVYLRSAESPGLGSCSLTGPLDQATKDIPLLNKLAK